MIGWEGPLAESRSAVRIHVGAVDPDRGSCMEHGTAAADRLLGRLYERCWRRRCGHQGGRKGISGGQGRAASWGCGAIDQRGARVFGSGIQRREKLVSLIPTPWIGGQEGRPEVRAQDQDLRPQAVACGGSAIRVCHSRCATARQDRRTVGTRCARPDQRPGPGDPGPRNGGDRHHRPLRSPIQHGTHSLPRSVENSHVVSKAVVQSQQFARGRQAVGIEAAAGEYPGVCPRSPRSGTGSPAVAP